MYLFKTNITHVAHIDIDEFIVLKKHNNIEEFINEYIVGNCCGIGINWRFFGSSNKTTKTDEPNTIRFTMCSENADRHIKTLFNKDYFVKFNGCHNIETKNNYYIKSTKGDILTTPFNYDADISIIQLNHYKSKTFEEFKIIRMRQRADFALNKQPIENVEETFKIFNKNDVEDLTAYNFYIKNCL